MTNSSRFTRSLAPGRPIGDHFGAPARTAATISSYGRSARSAIAVSASPCSRPTEIPAHAFGSRSRTYEVGGHVPGGPPLAQRRCVRAELVQQVAERGPFGVGDARHAMDPNAVSAPNDLVVRWEGRAAKGERLSRGSTDVLVRGLRVLGIGIREQWRVFTLAVIGSALYGAMTVASAFVLGRVTAQVIVPAFERRARPRPARWPARPRRILGVAMLKVARHRRPAGRAPGSCSTGCRRRTGAGSPGSTCGSRCPGTSSTRPARCCPTRTPTSRPRWYPIAPLPLAVRRADHAGRSPRWR